LIFVASSYVEVNCIATAPITTLATFTMEMIEIDMAIVMQ
jgi:hypothetical protein